VALLPIAIPVSYFLLIHSIPRDRTEQNRTGQTESLNLIKMKGRRKKNRQDMTPQTQTNKQIEQKPSMEMIK